MAFLETVDVSKNYGAFTALRSVSLRAEEGRTLGILGPNGAGKTTLIRMLAGLQLPTTGSIAIEGKARAKFVQNRLGYLPEERGLYRTMRVWEQANYMLQLKGLSATAAAEALEPLFEKHDLNQWRKKPTATMSKGMQQRLQFLISIAHKPKLLILDEPFSGLDPLRADEVKAELHELRAAGTCVLLSTHNMNTAEELCDDVAFIAAGALVDFGTLHEVKSRYQKSHAQLTYSGSAIALANALGSRFVLQNSEAIDNYQSAVVECIAPATISELIRQVAPAVDVISAQPLVPSLHSIFKAAVTQPKSK